jgi:hypothetical protein
MSCERGGRGSGRRSRLRNRDASHEELALRHGGDGLLDDPGSTTTYGVTVNAPAG